jgi:hypothetical protein
MRFLTYITGFVMNFELGKSSKFIKNPVIYVKKLIIMLITVQIWALSGLKDLPTLQF